MKKINLLDDRIYRNLVRLSLPMMCTCFIEMSYMLMDTFWVGKLGTESIAAVGIVSFIMWFAYSIALISKIGTSIGVSYSVGSKDDEQFRTYIDTSIVIGFSLSIILAILFYIFKVEIISFFNVKNDIVTISAIKYLKIILLGTPFVFLNPIFSSIFTGSANSKTPLIASAVGLFVNLILDPILIYGYFGFPALGVEGAAIATVFSQGIVLIMFILFSIFDEKIFKGINLISNFKKKTFKDIFKLGVPVAFKSLIFAIISTILIRIIAIYGESAVAAENIAVQIESINWMTVDSFSVSLCTLISQNYGAKNYNNIVQGYKKGLKIILSIGVFCSVFLFFSSTYIINLFVRSDNIQTIDAAVSYLKILAFSEIFLSLEVGISGMFNGLKNTKTPTIISTICNALRIPLAFLFYTLGFKLEYIWGVISFCTFLKGIITYIAFKKFVKKFHLDL